MTEQFELKPISKEGIPAALQKAERYRLINDPSSAESICLDVLEVDPDNQEALVTLLLAITDQFADGPAEGVRRAQELLPRLDDEYKRTYYAASSASAAPRRSSAAAPMGRARWPTTGSARRWSWYEKAEALRPAGNDEAILRWNTCARILARDENIRPRVEDSVTPGSE